jgi:hypothetical protein
MLSLRVPRSKRSMCLHIVSTVGAGDCVSDSSGVVSQGSPQQASFHDAVGMGLHIRFCTTFVVGIVLLYFCSSLRNIHRLLPSCEPGTVVRMKCLVGKCRMKTECGDCYRSFKALLHATLLPVCVDLRRHWVTFHGEVSHGRASYIPAVLL